MRNRKNHAAEMDLNKRNMAQRNRKTFHPASAEDMKPDATPIDAGGFAQTAIVAMVVFAKWVAHPNNPRLPATIAVAKVAMAKAMKAIGKQLPGRKPELYAQEDGTARILRGHLRFYGAMYLKETEPDTFAKVFPNDGMYCILHAVGSLTPEQEEEILQDHDAPDETKLTFWEKCQNVLRMLDEGETEHYVKQSIGAKSRDIPQKAKRLRRLPANVEAKIRELAVTDSDPISGTTINKLYETITAYEKARGEGSYNRGAPPVEVTGPCEAWIADPKAEDGKKGMTAGETKAYIDAIAGICPLLHKVLLAILDKAHTIEAYANARTIGVAFPPPIPTPPAAAVEPPAVEPPAPADAQNKKKRDAKPATAKR